MKKPARKSLKRWLLGRVCWLRGFHHTVTVASGPRCFPRCRVCGAEWRGLAVPRVGAGVSVTPLDIHSFSGKGGRAGL